MTSARENSLFPSHLPRCLVCLVCAVVCVFVFVFAFVFVHVHVCSVGRVLALHRVHLHGRAYTLVNYIRFFLIKFPIKRKTAYIFIIKLNAKYLQFVCQHKQLRVPLTTIATQSPSSAPRTCDI